VAWNGPVAAMVSAPKTWVIDNERRFLQGCVDPSALPQFTMYPLGHTRDSALARGAFIYGKIILKSPDFPTVEAVAVSDEERVLKEVPSAKFEWLEPLERQTHLGNELEKTILRIGRIHSGYKGPEYSLYIDHPEGVLLLVLFCPEGDDDLYVPSLKWIGRKAIMMNCTDTRQSCGSVP
jgi:hypothetical protein